MKNTLQSYAWGSKTAIAKLMAKPNPTENPEAELWMGAHPKSPSRVMVDNRWMSLDEWISQNPEAILGTQVCKRFNSQLPYLFKILAAGQPLSIQAHPSTAQARIGFENENGLKIPMDAAHRNYKDRRHKPECICALTSFWALCGFRQKDDILATLDALWPSRLRQELSLLETSGLKTFFTFLMEMGDSSRMALVDHVARAAEAGKDSNPIQQWMVRLQEKYPGDVGVLSPGLLNLIQLQPGEAIALASGQLHTYLDGLGIELMANSDNVIRGGLTPKHVDLPELLKVLTFKSEIPEILNAYDIKTDEKVYPSRAEEFKLSVINSAIDKAYGSGKRSNIPEIFLCTQGEARLIWSNEDPAITLAPGQSAFVPAMVARYTIEGETVIFKATVNIDP